MIFGLLLPLNLFSQNLPNIIPPSPKTQEIHKYIDFPVDYSTGIPEISIPLYVIKTKGIEIPISLNYHASGIKSGQDDGDVGLGWSLSSNYRVSRTIYGRPDSKDIEMPSNFESARQNFAINLMNAYTFPDRDVFPEQVRFEWDKYLAKFFNMHDNTMMPPAIGQLLDGEYDHFNYSLPGQTGTFVINNRITKNILEFNPTNNKFDYLDDMASNGVTRGIIGFKIRDDNQNIYNFGEQVDKRGFKVLEAIDNYYARTVATAWALTDIDTKYGEKIKFNYNNKVITTKYQVQATINVLNCFNLLPWEANVNSEYDNRSYSVFTIADIITSKEKVEFIEYTGSPFKNKINQINIYNILNDSLMKRIQFYYSDQYAYPNNYIF